MKKLGIVLLVVALLATCAPVMTLAYTAGTGSACTQAKTDAGIDGGTMKWLWFGAGCFFNLLGVLGGYLIPMAVPANRIMGKSADYVSNYTACYQEQTKSDNGMAAVWGCVASSVAYIAYFVYVAVVAASIVNTNPYIY